MAGVLDFLTGGGDDSAVAAFLQADRGLLNRLGAYMQAKQAAPVMAQRKQILQEAFTPASEEQRIPEAQGQSLLDMATQGARSMPQMTNSPVPMPRVGGADFKAMTRPDTLPKMTERVIPAKAAEFDTQSAIARLRSIGDIETANSLLDGDYKQALAGSRAAGKGEKWYGNRQLVKGSDGKMYHQILSDAGNAKLVPIDGDLTGELKQMDLDGQKVWVNGYTGQPVRSFAVTPTAYQSWQMDDNAQARQALSVEQAKVTGKLGAEKAADIDTDIRNASDAIFELDNLTGALNRLPAPAAIKADNVMGFFGAENADIQEALGEVERISGRMLKYVERLPGAATDKDRQVFMASAGVISDTNAPISRRISAAKSARESYQRLVEKYGNGAPAPVAAPTARPAPSRPAAGGPITVRAPNGKVYTFPDKKSADNFKLKAGIR